MLDQVHVLNAMIFGEQAEVYLDCRLEVYQIMSAKDRDTWRRERENIGFNVWIDTKLKKWNDQESLEAIVQKIEVAEE